MATSSVIGDQSRKGRRVTTFLKLAAAISTCLLVVSSIRLYHGNETPIRGAPLSGGSPKVSDGDEMERLSRELGVLPLNTTATHELSNATNSSKKGNSTSIAVTFTLNTTAATIGPTQNSEMQPANSPTPRPTLRRNNSPPTQAPTKYPTPAPTPAPTCHQTLYTKNFHRFHYAPTLFISIEEEITLIEILENYYRNAAFTNLDRYARIHGWSLLILQSYEWISIDTMVYDDPVCPAGSQGGVPNKMLSINMTAKAEFYPCAPLTNDFESVLKIADEFDDDLTAMYREKNVSSGGGRSWNSRPAVSYSLPIEDRMCL